MRKIKFRYIYDDEQIVYRTPTDFGHPQLFTEGLVFAGQYTGLKDKNGVEIYEGDVVSDFGIYGRIEYYLGSFVVNYISERRLHSLSGMTPSTILEVIGSIYKNPELLKEE